MPNYERLRRRDIQPRAVEKAVADETDDDGDVR
jgi:hypothetical protein